MLKLWSYTNSAIERMLTSLMILPQLNDYEEVGPGWKKWLQKAYLSSSNIYLFK